MSKKKSVFTITEDLSDLFIERPEAKKSDPNRLTIEKALASNTKQMAISGNRPRTISDYTVHVNHFKEKTEIIYLSDITAERIYDWLSIMDVSNQTKLTRLKCLKAFLSRCYSNGWIDSQFWKPITIRVDNNVKEGATERDIRKLLSLLDLGDFVQLRDATAALLMFKTGVRINTIVHLENKHIDFVRELLRLDGAIMKNHQQLLLPFDDTLARMLSTLLRQNDAIRREYGVENNYVFITKQGGVISNSPTHNNIQKRLNKYSQIYGLRNINPHALRRGFAKSLLNKGANVAEISKALGHSSLAVTTQYLHLDKEEVAESLRKYL